MTWVHAVAMVVVATALPVGGAEQAVHARQVGQLAATESFDGLSGQLQTRKDETGIPATLKGWTHTAPEGWTVWTDPAMAGLGTTEWRGWSFVTPEFWKAAEANQGRENFTKGSGVIAVADNDEWDDRGKRPGTQRFASKLTSPAWDVAGKSEVFVNFDSNYRQVHGQIAAMEVAFDGGSPQRLFQWDSVTVTQSQPTETTAYRENELLAQKIKVPAGAQTVKVTWIVERGEDDWYWAIDDISLSDTPAPGSSAPLPGVEDIPNGTSDKKVLLIGIDGMRWDKVRDSATPNIDALATDGQIGPTYLHGLHVAKTDSGPGHTNFLTGVWPDKHKVKDNTFAGHDLRNYLDILTRLETERPSLSTFSIGDWPPINSFIIRKSDAKMQQTQTGDAQARDLRTADMAVQAMKTQNPDVGYIYFYEPDGMGHKYGPESAQYATAIKNIDKKIGAVVDAVRARPTYAQEDWLFLVSTDHGMEKKPGGQVGGRHGSNGHDVREIWTLASGGKVPAIGQSTRQWRQVDLATTVLAHLNIPVQASWKLDGIEIGSASTDPFDTLYGSLRGVHDEAPKPDKMLGWTKTTPSGWAIEEKTPNVGVAEYRGWSFMTGQFWATSHIDQGRESFFRGRDIIAVADPDEWDDKGSPTTKGHRMDSNLLSPWQDVTPGQQIDVGYMSHYRQITRSTDPQKAQVVLRYDNGQQQVLWSRNSTSGPLFEISKRESFTATAPDGVTKVRVGWRMYDAANNYYWAIDDPQVRIR